MRRIGLFGLFSGNGEAFRYAIRAPAPPKLPGRMNIKVPKLPDGSAQFASRETAGPKSPSEVFNMFVEFVPTYFVPCNAVKAILPEEHKAVIGRKHQIDMFLSKYKFYFEMRQVDERNWDVRLRSDVAHPKKGFADEKYQLAEGMGGIDTYTPMAHLVEVEDFVSRSVHVKNAPPPPSISVQLKERVPVVDRLRALCPKEFEPIEEVEERIPNDVLYHPYFDCQGGLTAIATKFPESFQVVGKTIRLKPHNVAPLALDDLGYESSPVPHVMGKVKEIVCETEVPSWVSLTSIYERLEPAERQSLKKKGYKSFAGFLRSHGSVLAVSSDCLNVSRWSPKKKKLAQDDEPHFTPQEVIVAIHAQMRTSKAYALADLAPLLTCPNLLQALPGNLLKLVAQNPDLFVVEGDAVLRPDDVRVFRVKKSASLDLVKVLYKLIGEEGIAYSVLEEQAHEVSPLVTEVGLNTIISALPDWLELLDGDVFRLKEESELDEAMVSGSPATVNKGEE